MTVLNVYLFPSYLELVLINTNSIDLYQPANHSIPLGASIIVQGCPLFFNQLLLFTTKPVLFWPIVNPYATGMALSI